MPRKIKLSVFCGASVDGFIARLDHGLDFLDTHEQEPHGFEEFFNSVDVIVIGRKTYEVVKGFGGWAYGKKPVVVLSTRKINFSSIRGGAVEQMSGEPAKIVAQLEARGIRHAYIDGGITIQRFLAAGLIDRMVISRIAVLIGEGIPLFGPLPHDVRLRLVASRTFRGGLSQTEYEVMREKPAHRSGRKAKGKRHDAQGPRHEADRKPKSNKKNSRG